MEYNDWSLQELSEKNTQMYKVGYILAPVYVDFIKWVLSQTDKPAYVLLRDGQPIYDISKMLSKLPEFKNVETWETRYITRSVMTALGGLSKDDALNYLDVQGVTDGTHVFIDTGFAGSIQNRLRQRYDINAESFFMFYGGCIENIQGYKNPKNSQLSDISFINEFIFETIPKLSQSLLTLKINGTDIQPIPETSSVEQQFYKSFTKGAAAYIRAMKKVKALSANKDLAEKILADGDNKLVIRKALKQEYRSNGVFEYSKETNNPELDSIIMDMKKGVENT